jgi:hypothetical protein
METIGLKQNLPLYKAWRDECLEYQKSAKVLWQKRKEIEQKVRSDEEQKEKGN